MGAGRPSADGRSVHAGIRLHDSIGIFAVGRADNVTVFRADAKTGGPAFTGQYTPVGNPWHIVFVDFAKPG
jgi:6-phosphogluconolactonase (cycloisomerase 2 family)